MSTKMDPEAMAWKRFPLDNCHNDQSRHNRHYKDKGYAIAVREVAQPIADQRDELLEALRECAELVDGYAYDTDIETGTASALGRIAEKARSAIAKATGTNI